ncbi:hypothetical protein WJX73_007406 [Symbiochloris irregularis]|uniref:Carboxypeptidase n=1 Tax=Symbiochloris irregularis TaxID=706552 RepID=A0AAW1PAE5_9CHLO
MANGLAAEQTAGYFRLNRTHEAYMFYFYFENRAADSEAPLVVWMTGGPGCSSELAVFYENGPYTITKDLSLKTNPYGWDQTANMIYVDQPIGTGFSYSEDERDRVFDERVVGLDMLDFLLEFLEARPQYQDRDFYVTGESYAGHYVPAVSHRIYSYNKNVAPEKQINLKGLAIGNGLTNPAIQYGAYADYALLNKIIGQATHSAIKSVYPVCKIGLELCNAAPGVPLLCSLALTFCQSTQFGGVMAVAGDMNVYDIRKPCVGALCYDFSRLDKYLAQPDVRDKLGVGDREWTECNFDVNADFLSDWPLNYDTSLIPLLESDIRVTIYAGVEDFICNWLGNKRWVDLLPWSGNAAWKLQPEQSWTLNDTVVGSARQLGNLNFIKINGAGHMVPMDQPAAALDMFTRFLRNETFPGSAAADASRLPLVTTKELDVQYRSVFAPLRRAMPSA